MIIWRVRRHAPSHCGHCSPCIVHTRCAHNRTNRTNRTNATTYQRTNATTVPTLQPYQRTKSWPRGTNFSQLPSAVISTVDHPSGSKKEHRRSFSIKPTSEPPCSLHPRKHSRVFHYAFPCPLRSNSPHFFLMELMNRCHLTLTKWIAGKPR
jgi:hypothetical protein